MTDRNSDESLIHSGLYEQAINEIGTLRDKLPEEAFASLAREVIKRLSTHPAASESSIAFPSGAKIDELARALIEEKADAGIAFVETVRSQGASVETVYLAYLTEAAKTLGNWWDEDKITFTEVTVGTGHIYAIMRGLRPLFRPAAIRHSQPTALFSGIPGENHLLGVSMAADLFRKDGWDIMLKRGLEHDEIVHYAAQSQFPVVGLSAGGEHSVVPLAKLVVALRISVPDASIMVSGAVLETSYDEVREMGIDIIPTSIEDALTQARDVWDQTTARSQVG